MTGPESRHGSSGRNDPPSDFDDEIIDAEDGGLSISFDPDPDGGGIDVVPDTRERAEELLNQPRSVSDVLSTVLASSPLEPFQGLLSEQMFAGEAYGVAHLFLRKRKEYFTAYALRMRGSTDAPDKRAYEQARQDYNFATQEVVRELRGVKVREGLDDSWKSELVDAFMVRDMENLEKIGEAASNEKRRALKARIKKMPFMRGALVALAGLAAAQTLDVDTPSLPTYQTTAEGEARTAPPPEVEKVQVFVESVKAMKGEGVNQMVLDMLEKVAEIHPQALEHLQHKDESLIETAERITQESGLWNIETNFNFKVGEGDELSFVGGEKNGKLLYTSFEHGSFYLTGNDSQPIRYNFEVKN